MKSKSKIKAQGFLQGALIIAVAHIFVKVIGGLFKIPLARFILGPDGMGIYNSSYTIYNALFIISTAGLPVAISKMISESVAKGNYNEAGRIFKVAKMLLCSIGIIGFCILFFGAGWFAENYLQLPSTALAITAMAPSLFFVSLMSVYRGFFQGMSNMIPTAYSEVIEASGKLFIGLALAWLFLPMGKEYASAGAILGVSIGTMFGALFLAVYYRNTNRELKQKIKSDAPQVKVSSKSILKRLVKLAVPITLGASVFTLASVIDLTMILRQLADLGFDENARETMYGYYSGYAVTMFNVPPTIIASLSVSIVPAISAALVRRETALARKTTETALRITYLFALPCAVGMSVLAEPILNLAFGDVGAGTLLTILAYGILFVSIVMVSNAIIQAMGKVWVPVVNMCIGGAVKVLVNYILVGNINININGAPVGTDLCYLVTATLNLIAIHRYLKPSYGFGLVVKPIFVVALMGVSAHFVYTALASHISYVISLLAAVLVGGIIYVAGILALGCVTKQDVSAMPGAEKISKLIGRFIKTQ